MSGPAQQRCELCHHANPALGPFHRSTGPGTTARGSLRLSPHHLGTNKQWNVWDPLHGEWVPIPVPCNHFPSQTWIHLVWTLERVGNQVHDVTLSVADQTYNVDVHFTAQPKWYQEEIDIAFQMNGNYKAGAVQSLARRSKSARELIR
ncbi:MAG TPA: hypothetical protein VI685_11085 [Candidatus Angelobacter sp.]